MKCSKVPLRVRANKTFLMDTTKFKDWEDIKNDMNGTYPSILRTCTWTVEIQKDTSLKVETCKVIAKTCQEIQQDDQYHLKFNSKKKQAGQCADQFSCFSIRTETYFTTLAFSSIILLQAKILLNLRFKAMAPPLKVNHFSLDRFCTSELMSYPCSVDPTFSFGKYEVTPFCYRHLFLKSKRTQVPPIFIGPIALHHSKSKQTYKKIVDEVTAATKGIAQNAKGFITDGEVALHESLKEGLITARGLRCFAHFQRNCIDKLNSIGIKQKRNNRFS